MKNILLFLSAVTCAAFIHVNVSRKNVSAIEVGEIRPYIPKSGYGCSPNLTLIDFDDSSTFIPLLDGWGKYRMPVTVTSDSANIYFQQGINMYYGFHIIEALASFEKATKFDENFAMGYWGIALAFGPNINNIEYSVSPKAIEAIRKAKALCGKCTSLERALIDAIEVRYSTDTSRTREYLDQLYADAMKKVHADFPKSPDAAALYADALMVQHPWDLYDRFYNPKPWTPRIVGVLEKLVKQFPENPGANHYYIHAIEGSKHPEQGLEVANRLGGLMPGLSHVVHMPSHIYIRSGFYNKGVDANELAVKDYYNYLSKYPLTVNNSYIYLVHNQHMQAACASMDGQYAKALKFSHDTQKGVDTAWVDGGGYFGTYSQYMYMTPYFTWIRFGKWEDILNSASIPDSRVYANILWRYARGLAFARKHQFDEANMELQKIQESKAHSQLQESPTAFNPGIASVQVAEKILQGVIAEERNQFTRAVELLKEAVDQEDGMLYNEPKDWLLPSRQYLGHALLKAMQYKEAEKVYREDLIVNPNNAWSLTGLETALRKQGKDKEAMAVQLQAKKALTRSDTKISASVF